MKKNSFEHSNILSQNVRIPHKKELRYTNYGNKDKRALRALVAVGLSLDPSVKKGTLVYRGCWHSVWR